MNTINYSNDFKQFPLSTRALEFAQNMIKQCFNLALLGGSTPYILSGCENTTGNTWSAGLVVVNGELMVFSGGTGTLTSSVRVKTTTEDVVAGYETYEALYTTRALEFGTNVGNTETYTWSDFVRIKSNLELAAQYATKTELEELQSLVMPKGGIIMWSGSVETLPTGFHMCNGDTVAGFGAVPDLRGRFIVGYDETSSNTPPNVTDEKTNNYGKIGNTGGKPNVLLSANQSGLRSHFHWLFKVASRAEQWFLRDHPTYTAITDGLNEYGSAHSYGIQHNNDQSEANAGKSSSSADTAASETHENRPPYYVLAYIIKVV